MANIVEIRGVSKVYTRGKQKVEVLHGVDLDIARGEEADVFDRAVDVQISRLRRKLHACSEGEIIKTVRGAGYMFDVPVTRP